VTAQHKPRDIDAWLQALGEPGADRDYKPGHDRVLALLNTLQAQGFALQKPKLRIRVAGTNGKGSTAHFLAAALQANNLKVGLYTSPHILSFHERMRVDGKPIAQESLLELMTLVIPLALDVGTSYFETASVLALLHFSQQQVDVEILEAGVGAKLDATTAVPADIGLLTPVGLDHQAWLGDTLADITQEKAYVFKGCSVNISAQQDEIVQDTLSEHVKGLMYAPLFSEQLSMVGEHQQVNAGLALSATQAIHRQFFPVNLDKARAAMRQLNITGRMQCMSCGKHTFYLDAAHNEHAIHALLPTLDARRQPFDVIILATREDRDLSQCVSKLEKYTDAIVVMSGERHDYLSVSDALDSEIKGEKNKNFLILGSFVTLGEVFRWVNKIEL